MAWRAQPVDMEYDDDDLLDRMGNQASEPPSYPPNLCFTIAESDLEKVGGAGGGIGDTMPFAAMGEVNSVHASADGSRVEINLTQFAGEDGKFFDLNMGGHICFCDYELGKLDLDSDCEVGDMIHLVGEASLQSIHRSEFSEMATLQIIKLAYIEDESAESREKE